MSENRSFVLLIALAIPIGCIFIPAISTALTDQKGIPLKIGDTTGFVPVHLIKVDQDIKNATPDWLTLVANPDERDLLLKYMDNSSASQAEKEYLKNSLIKLWDKYPLEYRDEGNTTYISFKNKVVAQVLTSVENSTINRIAALISEGGDATYANQQTGPVKKLGESIPKVPFTPVITRAPTSSEKNSLDDTVGGPQLQWESVTCHGHLIFIPLCKITTWDRANIAANTADDPDFWGEGTVPSWLPGGATFMQIIHSWRHYWNPTYQLGGAPAECSGHASSARTNYQNGNYNNAFSYLGWSSHFMDDVSNPMHTGAELTQIIDPPVHYAYENYVYVKWDSEYAPILWQDPYFYPMNDPAEYTRYGAEQSQIYLDTLIQRVQIDRTVDNMDNDPTVVGITTNCLLLGERLCWGLSNYIGEVSY